jgi:hypothetical protein
VKDTLALLPVKADQIMVFPREDGITYSLQPVRDDALFDVSPDGDEIVVVQRDAPTSKGEAFVTVSKIRPDGDTLYSRSFAYEPIPVDQGKILRFLFGADRPGLGPVSRKEYEDKLSLPPFLPPVSEIEVGEDGAVWLRREDDFVSQSFRWDVLDTSGNPIYWVELPRAIRPHWVAEQACWGVELGEYDIPYVVGFGVGGPIGIGD